MRSLLLFLTSVALAAGLSGCCKGDSPDPVQAALDAAAGDLGCPPTGLLAQVEWDNSSCDPETGDCTDEVFVRVDGCGREGLYDCTQCGYDYLCSRIPQ